MEKTGNMNPVKKNEPELDAIRGRSGDVLGHAKSSSLILVAGHAILRRLDSLESDDGWFLKHFQAGEAKSYIEHVRRGVLLASGDPDAICSLRGAKPTLKRDLVVKAKAIGLSRTISIGSVIVT